MSERDDLITAYRKGAEAFLAAVAEAPKAAWTWKPAPSATMHLALRGCASLLADLKECLR